MPGGAVSAPGATTARPATVTLPAAVTIRDVGPRDGLQPEEPVPVPDRVRLVHALADAGVSRIEVAAFVSPKAVPAMAGAAEVVAGIERRPGVTYAALVPNPRGAEMALESDLDELTVTISASETYNQRNVRMSTEESVEAIARIVELARAADGRGARHGGAELDEVPVVGVPVDAVISCAFGSPYEGEIAPAEVVTLARRLAAAGVSALTFADTTGMATPRRVADLVAALDGALSLDGSSLVHGESRARNVVASVETHGLSGLGLHLHDTRGTALVNAYAALALGITRFDTAVGGLGGSPFAHGAGGNLATEELVALLDDLGVHTGIDIEGLVDAALLVEGLVGRPVPSGVAHAGPRTRRAPSA
ncbi:MAG TPA: hydroxymethylglutaryl-CoA lyase [Acidimicrobiales bacterium]|nr:hydroxymethylglutaryl-CoA lyase [Acidimicrobiales bacterium]